MPKSKLVIATLLLLSSTASSQPSVNVIYNYSQWDRAPYQIRVAYLAGTMDTLSSWSTSDDFTWTTHFSNCYRRLGMTTAQLTDNLQGYVRAHPKVVIDTVPTNLARYLVEVCGSAIKAK